MGEPLRVKVTPQQHQYGKMDDVLAMFGLLDPDFSWKEWQGLFGSLIGFFGIILTLMFNAYQARKLQRAKIDEDRRIAAEKELADRRGFLVAIRAELNNYLDELESMAKPFGEAAQDFYIPPTLYEATVYRSIVARIVLVQEETARAVVKAYQMLPDYDHDVAWAVEKWRTQFKVDQIGAGNYVVPLGAEPGVMKITRTATLPIRFAVDAIDRELDRIDGRTP